MGHYTVFEIPKDSDKMALVNNATYVPKDGDKMALVNNATYVNS